MDTTSQFSKGKTTILKMSSNVEESYNLNYHNLEETATDKDR